MDQLYGLLYFATSVTEQNVFTVLELVLGSALSHEFGSFRFHGLCHPMREWSVMWKLTIPSNIRLSKLVVLTFKRFVYKLNDQIELISVTFSL